MNSTAERTALVAEALREDRDRLDARMARDREQQRSAEVAKSARLRELRLAKEAADARAKKARSPLPRGNARIR